MDEIIPVEVKMVDALDKKEQLSDFQNDSSKREVIKSFMVETLKQMAVTKVMNGESVLGLKEAFDLVEEMFAALDREYAK